MNYNYLKVHQNKDSSFQSKGSARTNFNKKYKEALTKKEFYQGIGTVIASMLI